MAKVGRNEPCPCNSGRKYKHCCIGRNAPPHDTPKPGGKFRFDVGSYGDSGYFMPSLLCWREVGPDKWEPYYCLVKPDDVFDKEDPAIARASEHLMQAAIESEMAGNASAAALLLRERGYKSVDDFRIAPEDARDVPSGGFHARG